MVFEDSRNWIGSKAKVIRFLKERGSEGLRWSDNRTDQNFRVSEMTSWGITGVPIVLDTWVAFGGFGIDVGQPNLKISVLKYFVNINYCSLEVILI